MSGAQTFYSFSATLIPGLLFGTIRAAMTPRTTEEVADAVKRRLQPEAVSRAFKKLEAELGTEVVQANREELERMVREGVISALDHEVEDLARTQLRVHALVIVLAVGFALTAEGSAIYAAVARDAPQFYRDYVVICVMAGMTVAAVVAFWPWIRHLAPRAQVLGLWACAGAVLASTFFVLRGLQEDRTAVGKERRTSIEHHLTEIHRNRLHKELEASRLLVDAQGASGLRRKEDVALVVGLEGEAEELKIEEQEEEKALHEAIEYENSA